jgi:hypothetical protein
MYIIVGPLERQLDYWLKRAQELGAPCAQWSQGVLQRKGGGLASRRRGWTTKLAKADRAEIEGGPLTKILVRQRLVFGEVHAG